MGFVAREGKHKGPNRLTVGCCGTKDRWKWSLSQHKEKHNLSKGLGACDGFVLLHCGDLGAWDQGHCQREEGMEFVMAIEKTRAI